MWYESHLSEIALKMAAAICLLEVIFKMPVIGGHHWIDLKVFEKL